MKLISVTLMVVGLAAISTADLRSEITAWNNKIHQSMVKGDMKALVALMKSGVTSNFQYVESGKTMTFDQMAEQMKASMSMMKTKSASTTIVSLKQTGSTAVSVEKHSMVMTMTGADKKAHKVTMSGPTTNTYVKSGNTWKMSKMSWGKTVMMMDGKPMDMSKMGG